MRAARVVVLGIAALAWCGASPSPIRSTPTPVPEPSPPFGRVVYRAARVAGFESLGITMIACRHRDPVPRRFAVQFFDLLGRPVSTFGNIPASPPTPAGKKLVFVTDGMWFVGREVLNIRLGHLTRGTARVVSDATVFHCVGKMRMDGGYLLPSYREEIGLVREGRPLPVLPEHWKKSPWKPAWVR